MINATATRHHPRNMVEHLQDLAARRPHDTALIALGADGERRYDYTTLDLLARAMAARLQARFAPGERALLLLDNDEHYLVAFFGCLYAGLIAVPVFPPESAREQHLERLLAIAADAGAACILGSAAILALLGDDGGAARFGAAAALAVDALDPAAAADRALADSWRAHAPRDADIAFLQYTSGSTAVPKGVMVSHGNLMANERAIEAAMAVTADDVFVSWLPLYHDMGLIGGALQPLHRGIPVVLMSPSYFLQRPLRWLEAVSRHRGTISGGPDFAFRLCLDRVKPAQVAGLDLSSWRVAFSGAEPVRHDTLRDFISTFAPAGLRPGAVYPCYGLAEATLLLSGGTPGAGMTARRFSDASVAAGRPLADDGGEGLELVGCGAIVAGHRVEIVAPETLSALPAGQVGEILAAGPSIAAGYWRRDDASAETFIDHAGRRWLRTGDLGFLHDGQLYITGRLKDLIILRGQNIYPQDIERVIEMEVAAVRKGRVAAFAVRASDGSEGVGVCAEVSRGLQKLMPPAALAEALSAAASVACRNALTLVVLLQPGALPKTSSGKLRRGACRQGWLDGTLDAYAIWHEGRLVQGPGAVADSAAAAAPLSSIENELAALWHAALKLDESAPLARNAHFFSKGGNSLAAVQVAARAGELWNIDVAPQLLFEHPLLSDCASRIEALRATGAPRAGAIAALPAAARGAGVPLSPAQQRLWFLWRLDPASTAYHIGGTLSLDGVLDAASLNGAMLQLVRRHESLRTHFRAGADGAPEQVIAAAPAHADLIRLTTRDDSDALLSQPFDLERGPLLRASLRRDGEQRHTLVMVLHHIIADAWSMQRLIEELAACYQALRGGAAANLPALPIQYADYAQWQRGWLDGGERVRQLAYWRGALGTRHPVLDLRTDRPRGAARVYTAARHGFALPAELLAGLRARAGQSGTTLFTVLLAAFQTLLFRQTGQQDVRVGVPVANRNRPETGGVVGFFVNTQVLRNQIGPRMTLATVLAQARAAALGAQAHQELPFDELVEALQPQRSLSHNPLFQVLYNHLVEDYRALDGMAGLTIEVRPLVQPEAQFDLVLDTVETPDGRVRADFSYAAELFDAATIEAYGRQYLALLEHIAAAPDTVVADVDLAGAAGRAQLLAWGRNDGAALDTLPAHVRFERQAAAQPRAEALSCGADTLTYDALNRRANQLSHRLMAGGVAPGAVVGVALERTLDMVVGLLAILKTGAAYVPLDPDYPVERLAHMMRDSGLALLMTHSWLEPRLPRVDGVARLAVDTLDLEGRPWSNPGVAVHDDSLAYVIYTSGSTGTPKGVGIGHAALARHIDVSIGFFGLRADDRMLQFATLNFDGFIEQLFPPLAVGAAVVLRGADLWDSATFHDQLIERRISVADLTTAYWSVLAQDFAAHGPRSYGALRQVHAGGEALPPAALSAWRQAGLADVKLLNTYGPTEATVTASALDCAPFLAADAQLPAQMPIGAPLAGRRLYVLDSELGLAPPGVAGELYIGGALLARGYLNRPGLSAERFVADPFGADGARLYRTGDLVRWLSEGQLEYLGRVDHQVKLRGLRVELGEIEACLLSLAGVRAAVVTTQQGASGMLLVAHVAADPGVVLQGPALRTALAARLPDYMVPAAVMVLPALPLNPNGKVDRHALPAATPSRAGEYAAPQGDAEQALALLWQEVLGLERVGRRDNFFELGGHSLAAIRVTALLVQRYACELPVRRFFDASTLEAMARVLSEVGFNAAGGDARAQRLNDMDSLLSEFEG